MLKEPGTKRLTLKCDDEPLSSFAFKSRLRRYSTVRRTNSTVRLFGLVHEKIKRVPAGRCLLSFPIPLNFSLLCTFPLNVS
jgi:hypothetical protein